MYVRKQASTQVSMYACAYTCVCVYVQMYVAMHVCMYVCVWDRTHAYWFDRCIMLSAPSTSSSAISKRMPNPASKLEAGWVDFEPQPKP